ncbi:group II intron reverse transcriptase/maturase [Flavilitoribacter nigricans]|uniref:RNA-directed DNA polymerase n=1 Tax=Flavilitoribacter nigricans (strain ATCC 23147 / DSM 23189 / NBRC 102662 / NCIMB 1420 / SS-2) TaxID=1122177 RepID=A0A2D0N186_FLAN2|nr:group II intron reverse transcriptase/maturase [Flavilitoribacter nigricans]PHN02265.1 group II intron reverse transcriptase/maturase [Flavilitoribacter nigricans DSM 23189 = NBRC 102662]
MSKSDKKSELRGPFEQGDLFESQSEAGWETAGGTSRIAKRAELLSRLQEQRTLTVGIMDKISDYGSLGRAFQEVRRNQGAGGVDGVTLAMYEQDLTVQLTGLHDQLRQGNYRADAVRLVEIPKPNGGTRRLGIPTIEDRVVQQSLLNALQPIYDPYFSEYSYGFRPGRSAHQAIERAAGYVLGGKTWVVDIDLKSFFDEINHDRLMSRLNKAISDKSVLKLIRNYLRAGLMQDGLVRQRLSGTPQGGPLSPLLSNIVLDELDRELEVRGLSFARYADDCNIFVSSKRSAERVMSSLIQFIEEKLKLKVNREKSGVRRCDQVKFLGHTIEQNGKIRIADASVDRLKFKIREVTKRNRGLSLEQIIAQVNRINQGWAVYYRRCNTWLSTFRDLDRWIRKRLRCYALKQHQRRYATYRFLRSLGVVEYQAWNAVMYYSWWPMANYRPVMKAMGLQWFAEQGLRSIVVIQAGKS